MYYIVGLVKFSIDFEDLFAAYINYGQVKAIDVIVVLYF